MHADKNIRGNRYVLTITAPIVTLLEVRKSKLEEYSSQYNDVQIQIKSLDEIKGSDCAGYEEAFYLLSAKIRELSGISQTTTKSTQAFGIKLQSRFNSFSAIIQCVVTDQITGNLPAFTVKRDVYNLPRNLKLADPQFNVSPKIDILVGAEWFWDLLCVGQVRSSLEHPTLQKTQLVWILARRVGNSKSTRHMQSLHASITNVQLHDQLCRFR